MPKVNTPNTTQNAENEGIGIVILVEDKDRIEPSEDAKVLSAETGFPIVTQAAVTRATSNKKGAKRDKYPQSQSFLSADALWQLVYTHQGLSLRLSNEPSCIRVKLCLVIFSDLIVSPRLDPIFNQL